MKFKTIALVTALSALALPTASRADTVTLMGWGNAFAQAHAQQGQAAVRGQGEGAFGLQFGQVKAPTPAPATQPEAPTPVAVPNTPDAPKAEAPKPETPASEMAKAGASVAKSLTAKAGDIQAGAQGSLTASVELGSGVVQGVLGQVDGAYAKVGTAVEGVTAGAFNLLQGVADKASGFEVKADMAHTGSLAVGSLATVNSAANLAATASVVSAGQLGALTSMTSSLVQNVIAARPASLLGILR